jgi:hypothetical protein
VVEFFGQPGFTVLSNAQTVWPDTIETVHYFGGYAIDTTGLPLFKYQLGGTEITDHLYPEKDGTRALHREIHFQGDTHHLYCRLAEGKEIAQLPDGSFAIDDKNYYLVINQPEKAIQRNINGNKELLWPVDTSEGEAMVKYTLIW